jgi:hypothetical protein
LRTPTDEQATTAEPETTAGPVPTDSGTPRTTTDPSAGPAPETVAPGVTTDGVETVSVLAAAHAATLNDTSHTFTASFADHRDDGRLFSLTSNTVLFENESHW